MLNVFASKRRAPGRMRPAGARAESLESRHLLTMVISLSGGTVFATENQAFSNNVAGYFGAVVDGSPVTDVSGYAAKITWGDGTQSDALIGTSTGSTFPIEGSHTYLEGGSYPITLEVIAPDGTTATTPHAFAQVGDAPISVTPVIIAATAENGTIATVANLVDTNAQAPVSDYTASILWGDSSPSDPGQIISVANGRFQIVGTHTYPPSPSYQTYTVSVSVTDVDGASATTTSTAQVTASNPVPALQPAAGNVQLVNDGTPGTLATFHDPDPNAPTLLQAIIDWGDGTTGPGQIVLQGGTTYDVNGGHTFPDPGPKTISVTLKDGNGNEQTLPVDITVQPPATNGVDVAVTIDANSVVPTKASDLHLHHVYGSELVNAPVVIQNVGNQPAKGTAVLRLYLSPQPTVAKGGVLAKSQPVAINLQPGASQTVPLNNLVIPRALAAGGNYYLVAQLATSFAEADKTGNTDPNNTAATASTFEFVGTPNYPAVFTNGIYFNTIRDLLSVQGTFTNSFLQQRKPGADPTSDQQFIEAFEGTRTAAYLDGRGIPTIGIGLNLTTVSGPILDTLAADVKDYYAQNAGTPPYHDISGLSSSQVRSMLVAQARQGRRAPQVLTVPEVEDLFVISTLPTYESAARTTLGDAWPTDTLAQAALVDLRYQGALYPSVVSALSKPAGPDYVMAGFKLFDKLNTDLAIADPKHYGGLQTRIPAEYENLLYSNRSDLGTL